MWKEIQLIWQGRSKVTVTIHAMKKCMNLIKIKRKNSRNRNFQETVYEFVSKKYFCQIAYKNMSKILNPTNICKWKQYDRFTDEILSTSFINIILWHSFKLNHAITFKIHLHTHIQNILSNCTDSVNLIIFINFNRHPIFFFVK